MTIGAALLQLDGVSLPVRVTASARRKKTVSARIVDGVIDIRVPVNISNEERDRHVRDLAAKLERKRSATDLDLPERAKRLAATYDLPAPTSIVWSSRQNKRWGSCTPATGAIRISDRLADLPPWVLDYVIVHELAHLVHVDHGPEFQALVARFARAERAEGFLAAVSLGHAGSAPGMGWASPDEGSGEVE